MTDVNWDQATVAKLRELRAEGLTSAQIARVIGTTRSAIIGECKRLGIGTPNHPHVRPDLALPKPKPAESVPYVAPPPPVFAEPCEPVPTVALALDQCRWSDSAEAPWLHCGRPGRPWCPEHRRRVFQPKRAS